MGCRDSSGGCCKGRGCAPCKETSCASCRKCFRKGRASCPGATLFIVKILSSAAVVFSVLTVTECQFLRRTCRDAVTRVPTSCDSFPDYSRFGFLFYDAFSSDRVQVDTSSSRAGACVFSGWPQMDIYFSISRFISMVAIFVGAVSAFWVFSANLCCSGLLHLVPSGILFVICALLQGLTFLVWKSSFCVGTSGGVTSTCEIDRTAWLCIAAACCYFVSSLACFLTIPVFLNVKNEPEDEEEESIYLDAYQSEADTEFEDVRQDDLEEEI